MKKLFLFFLFFFSGQVAAQNVRPTSFDNRFECEKTNGVWRQFGNGCVDDCRAKFEKFPVCTQAITYSCDCGRGRCWDGDECVSALDYKKVFDEENEKEKKLLEEAKIKRKELAKKSSDEILLKLRGINPNAPNSQNAQNQQANGVANNNVAQTQLNQQVPPVAPIDIEPSPTNPITVINQQPPLNAENSKGDATKSDVQVEIPPYFLKKQQEAQNAASLNGSNLQRVNSGQSSVKPSNSQLPELPSIPLP